jgi:hypothetical protein
MAKLPQQLSLPMTQTTWAQQIDPVINNPLNQSSLLKSVVLTTGNNVINHKLGRVLQGWKPTRYHGAWAQIYDLQDTNQMPQLTLVLVASANVTIDIEVF